VNNDRWNYELGSIEVRIFQHFVVLDEVKFKAPKFIWFYISRALNRPKNVTRERKGIFIVKRCLLNIFKLIYLVFLVGLQMLELN